MDDETRRRIEALSRRIIELQAKVQRELLYRRIAAGFRRLGQ